MRMAPDIRRNLAPGGSVILSGILASQRRQVLAAYNGQGIAPPRDSLAQRLGDDPFEVMGHLKGWLAGTQQKNGPRRSRSDWFWIARRSGMCVRLVDAGPRKK